MVTFQDVQAVTLITNRTHDLIKKVSELLGKTQNVEVKEIIVDLRANLVNTKDLLIDAKTQLTDLKEENSNLKAKIKKLEVEKEKTNKLVFVHAVYFEETGKLFDNEPKFYCPKCYSTEKKSIPIAKKVDGSHSFYECVNCNKSFSLIDIEEAIKKFKEQRWIRKILRH